MTVLMSELCCDADFCKTAERVSKCESLNHQIRCLHCFHRGMKYVYTKSRALGVVSWLQNNNIMHCLYYGIFHVNKQYLYISF